jgi:hypothetical protein
VNLLVTAKVKLALKNGLWPHSTFDDLSYFQTTGDTCYPKTSSYSFFNGFNHLTFDDLNHLAFDDLNRLAFDDLNHSSLDNLNQSTTETTQDRLRPVVK